MIDLIDVSKSYGPGLPAVNHANLHVDKGEFVFIVGNSGSGKSTLIKLLLKELDSTSGTIIVSGEKLEGMKYLRNSLADNSGRTVHNTLGKSYILIHIPVLQKTEVLEYDAKLTAVFGHTAVLHSLKLLSAYDNRTGCV